MTRGTDDDALAWSGDDDPTLDVGANPAATVPPADREPEPEPEPDTGVESEARPDASTADAEPKALPDGFTAVGKGSDEVGHVHADGSITMPGGRRPMGNATLITLGILGGVYLIYAIGWVIGGLRLQGVPRNAYLLTDLMYQGAFWLAVLAPLLWFGTVFLLTMRSKPWARFAWLIAGAALLLPWPFVMIGTVGQ